MEDIFTLFDLSCRYGASGYPVDDEMRPSRELNTSAAYMISQCFCDVIPVDLYVPCRMENCLMLADIGKQTPCAPSQQPPSGFRYRARTGGAT